MNRERRNEDEMISRTPLNSRFVRDLEREVRSVACWDGFVGGKT